VSSQSGRGRRGGLYTTYPPGGGEEVRDTYMYIYTLGMLEYFSVQDSQ